MELHVLRLLVLLLAGIAGYLYGVQRGSQRMMREMLRLVRSSAHREDPPEHDRRTIGSRLML